MTREEVFEKVKNGEMPFEDFDSWCADVYLDAYCDGASNQAYEDATSNNSN